MSATIASCTSAVARQTIPLIDSSEAFKLIAIKTYGSTQQGKWTKSGPVVVLKTSGNVPWAGIVFTPERPWDLDECTALSIGLRNVGDTDATVHVRVDSADSETTVGWNIASTTIHQGGKTTVQIRLADNGWTLGTEKLFGMRGYPEEALRIDSSRVKQVHVFVNSLDYPCRIEISDLRAIRPDGGLQSMESRQFIPFIDTFGQYAHRDWSGKVHSTQDLHRNRIREDRDIATYKNPPGWNKYGGWAAGPTLKSTGFFRTEKRNGKWWLVDPEGRLFFSHGMNCVGSLDSTVVDERMHWYKDFPGNLPEYKEFFTSFPTLMGHYAGKTPQGFSFHGANLKRKYGDNWEERSDDLAHRRLRSWGFNTVGSFSPERILLQRRTPYVAIVHYIGKVIEGSEGYWSKFPDAFDPSFEEGLRDRMAQEKGKTAGDPWCLGYFVNNELPWGDDTSLALAALSSPPEQAAKKAFIEDLKSKYRSIADLNQVWGTDYSSWENLLISRTPPDKEKARDDLRAFYIRAADRYFEITRRAVKEAAPNHLYLGCRLAWRNEVAISAAARHCDVVSFNMYQWFNVESIQDFRLPRGVDVPIMTGEFHFGSTDCGLFHPGLSVVKNEKERAEAFADYLKAALRHPQFVGCHWFQYWDQPTTGRTYDEENYNVGFVDTADTPYAAMVEACRTVTYEMYRYRLGR